MAAIDSPRIMTADIQSHRANHGVGKNMLMFMRQQRPFCEALASGIGQELLRDVMSDMDRLLKRIINESVSPQELAEYRVLKDIFTKWSTRIIKYFECADKLKG